MAGLPNQVSNAVRRRNPDLFGGGAPTEPIARRALHVPAERKIIRVTKSQEERLNKLEKRFLDYLRSTYAPIGWRIGVQDITVRLAADCRLTPDFSITWMGDADMDIRLIDVKGGQGAEDDAVVKLKTAAVLFPMFSFIIAYEDHRQWKFQPIPK